MITRDFGDGGWGAACAGMPPPLHVTADHPQAQWFPLARPYLRPTPPGPTMVKIPVPVLFGDDPTDPTQQTPGMARIASPGMIGRLNFGMAVGR